MPVFWYRHWLSIHPSFLVISSFAMWFEDPKVKGAFFITNWLCSKLLVTYPDRGDQANHFWYFFLFLSFLTQLSSAQLRGISAKFHINIFYFPWPPPMDKTIKNFYVSQYYTSALGSTVKCLLIRQSSDERSHWTIYLSFKV